MPRAGRRGRARWWPHVCAAWAFVVVGLSARGAENEKEGVRLHGAGSGRFEIVAEAGPEGIRLAELAAAAWSEWRGPLVLPARLPTAITVRLIPPEKWSFADELWRVAVEQTGLVTVLIRAGGETELGRERRWLTALAEGALRRKALSSGIGPQRIKAPAWLLAAAAEAVVIAERPAMLDAWQAEVAAAEQSPSLRDILLWENRAADESEDGLRFAAFGVWFWLREESGRSGAWERFVGAVVGGETPGAVLAREFGRLTPRPAEAREWELAWRVAKARLATARTTPVMDAAESRAWVERVARVVALDLRTAEERVMPAWGEWASREEAWLRTERAERARLIAANFNRLHPFYRNAAGSLGRAWAALAEGREEAWREASVEWSRDLADGRSLEDASRRLLNEAMGK